MRLHFENCPKRTHFPDVNTGLGFHSKSLDNSTSIIVNA